MSTSNFTSYDQVGVVEDVDDIISIISPTKTPFQSMIGSESVTQRLYEWQEDSLADAADNAQLEGADAPQAAQDPTVMRDNTTQIFSKTAKATGSARVSKTYGRGDELDYQVSKKMPELKRDFERALVGVHQSKVTGSSTVPRRFANYAAQLDTATCQYVVNGAGGGFGAYSSQTAGALREDSVLSVLQNLYTNGAEADTLMIKPADAVVVAGFQAHNRTVMVSNGQKKITNAVDVYESPFGDVKVVKNRFQATGDALVFEASMWKKAVFRNWRTIQLAKTGDSDAKQILGEFGLKHRNYKGSGLITNLT